MKTLGQRVKHAMQLRGMKPNQLDRALSARIGADYTGYSSRLANDKRKRPDPRLMSVIAQVLDVDFGWLMTGLGPLPRPSTHEPPDAVARQRKGREYHLVVESGKMLRARCGAAEGPRTTWNFAPPKSQPSCAICSEIRRGQVNAYAHTKQNADNEKTLEQLTDEVNALARQVAALRRKRKVGT